MAHRCHSTENLYSECSAIAGQWQVNGVADTVHRMFTPILTAFGFPAGGKFKAVEGAAVLEEACGVYSLGSAL